jgi:hypothetical protein
MYKTTAMIPADSRTTMALRLCHHAAMRAPQDWDCVGELIANTSLWVQSPHLKVDSRSGKRQSRMSPIRWAKVLWTATLKMP